MDTWGIASAGPGQVGKGRSIWEMAESGWVLGAECMCVCVG